MQSKLGKFKNTKISILSFKSPSQNMNQPSKYLLSVCQNNVYRIHKVKLIKLMSDKDFMLNEDDFSDRQDPFGIADVKKATYSQLSNVMIILDYTFCSLLQTSRLSNLVPNLSSDELCDFKIKNMIFNEGILITSESFKQNDEQKHVIKTYNLDQASEAKEMSAVDVARNYFLPQDTILQSIDFLNLPRLNWDDRQIQLSVISSDFSKPFESLDRSSAKQASLPKKLLIAGKY